MTGTLLQRMDAAHGPQQLVRPPFTGLQWPASDRILHGYKLVTRAPGSGALQTEDI